ncbi:MAG: hypothetical protein ABIO29_01125 [Sphingomicrobium sp.]
MKWRLRDSVSVVLALLAAPVFAPELLAFPYRATSADLKVFSEVPIDRRSLDAVTAKTLALVAASPLAEAHEQRRIFLTTGGWRWTWLALRERDSFGLSRPGRETIVLNRSDLAADRISNGSSLGNRRSLSGTLAHEICHGMTHRRFGIGSVWTKPAWLNEGYCDHVARESSLSDADVARLTAAGQSHPALIYYEGRRRVAAELARNHGDVDALFAAY